MTDYREDDREITPADAQDRATEWRINYEQERETREAAAATCSVCTKPVGDDSGREINREPVHAECYHEHEACFFEREREFYQERS